MQGQAELQLGIVGRPFHFGLEMVDTACREVDWLTAATFSALRIFCTVRHLS